jgi:hypothetical protein
MVSWRCDMAKSKFDTSFDFGAYVAPGRARRVGSRRPASDNDPPRSHACSWCWLRSWALWIMAR